MKAVKVKNAPQGPPRWCRHNGRFRICHSTIAIPLLPLCGMLFSHLQLTTYAVGLFAVECIYCCTFAVDTFAVWLFCCGNICHLILLPFYICRFLLAISHLPSSWSATFAVPHLLFHICRSTFAVPHLPFIISTYTQLLRFSKLGLKTFLNLLNFSGNWAWPS